MKDRRILFSILLAALFALLCFGAFAAVATTITINNGTGNSGVTLSDGQFLIFSGGKYSAVAADPDDGTMVATFKNGVFTLFGNVSIDNKSNASVTGSLIAFEADGDLTITAAPSHPGAKLTAIGADSSTASYSYGIRINGGLAMTGDVIVSGTGGSSEGDSYGVSVDKMDNGPTLIMDGNASLIGTGNNVVDGFSRGVDVGANPADLIINIKGNASITGTGGAAPKQGSAGVYFSGASSSNGSVNIEGNAKIKGTGGTSSNGTSTGIYITCSSRTLQFIIKENASMEGTAPAARAPSGVHLYARPLIATVQDNALITGESGSSTSDRTIGFQISSNGPSNITVRGPGAAIFGKSGPSGSGSSFGIYLYLGSSGNVEINVEDGGLLAGLAGITQPDNSRGIYCRKVDNPADINFTVKDGLVFGFSPEMAVELGASPSASASKYLLTVGGTKLEDSAYNTAKRLAFMGKGARLAQRLPDGTVGQDYSASLASGKLSRLMAWLAGGEYRYTSPQTDLPEGLSMNNRSVTGVPEKEGEYTFDGKLELLSGDGDSTLKVLPAASDYTVPVTYLLDVYRLPALANTIGSIKGYDGQITLRIVDGNGNPVPSASVRINGKSYTPSAEGTLSVPYMNGYTMAVYVSTTQYGEVKVRLKPISGGVYDVSITGQPEIALAKN